MKDLFMRGTSSFGVQLCGPCRKYRYLIKLSNQFSETTYLIFWLICTKVLFVGFSSTLCVCIFDIFVLSIWVEHLSIKSKKTVSSKQKKEAEGTLQKQLPTPTTPLISCFWQMYPLKLKLCYIIWNELLQVSASISMHTRQDIYDLIKKATSSH